MTKGKLVLVLFRQQQRMKLTGKLALVTGSTTGIGVCIAQSLAKAGCNVIVTGLGEKGVIDDIVDNLKT